MKFNLLSVAAYSVIGTTFISSLLSANQYYCDRCGQQPPPATRYYQYDQRDGTYKGHLDSVGKEQADGSDSRQNGFNRDRKSAYQADQMDRQRDEDRKAWNSQDRNDQDDQDDEEGDEDNNDARSDSDERSNRTFDYRSAREGERDKNMFVAHQIDHEILNDIKKALNADADLKQAHIDVRLVSGVVVLTGPIENQQMRDRLKYKIKKINGVITVDDRMEMLNDRLRNSRIAVYSAADESGTGNRVVLSAQSQEDKKISNKIRDALKKGINRPGYEQVTYEVNNGKVTLNGYVENESDKKKVEDKIKDIGGVESIENNINVKLKKSTF